MEIQFADTKKYQGWTNELRQILGNLLTPGKTFKERCTVQLNKWVDGQPVHNYIDDMCCPDFSCCKPELLSDRWIRVKFMDADEQQRIDILMGFFATGIELSNPGAEVKIFHSEEDMNEFIEHGPR